MDRKLAFLKARYERIHGRGPKKTKNTGWVIDRGKKPVRNVSTEEIKKYTGQNAIALPGGGYAVMGRSITGRQIRIPAPKETSPHVLKYASQTKALSPSRTKRSAGSAGATKAGKTARGKVIASDYKIPRIAAFQPATKETPSAGISMSQRVRWGVGGAATAGAVGLAAKGVQKLRMREGAPEEGVKITTRAKAVKVPRSSEPSGRNRPPKPRIRPKRTTKEVTPKQEAAPKAPKQEAAPKAPKQEAAPKAPKQEAVPKAPRTRKKAVAKKAPAKKPLKRTARISEPETAKGKAELQTKIESLPPEEQELVRQIQEANKPPARQGAVKAAMTPNKTAAAPEIGSLEERRQSIQRAQTRAEATRARKGTKRILDAKTGKVRVIEPEAPAEPAKPRVILRKGAAAAKQAAANQGGAESKPPAAPKKGARPGVPERVKGELPVTPKKELPSKPIPEVTGEYPKEVANIMKTPLDTPREARAKAKAARARARAERRASRRTGRNAPARKGADTSANDINSNARKETAIDIRNRIRPVSAQSLRREHETRLADMAEKEARRQGAATTQAKSVEPTNQPQPKATSTPPRSPRVEPGLGGTPNSRRPSSTQPRRAISTPEVKAQVKSTIKASQINRPMNLVPKNASESQLRAAEKEILSPESQTRVKSARAYEAARKAGSSPEEALKISRAAEIAKGATKLGEISRAAEIAKGATKLGVLGAAALLGSAYKAGAAEYQRSGKPTEVAKQAGKAAGITAAQMAAITGGLSAASRLPGVAGIAARGVGRTLLPVGAAIGAYDIGRAAYEGYRAFSANKKAKEEAKSSAAKYGTIEAATRTRKAKEREKRNKTVWQNRNMNRAAGLII